jgi:hypothetical protein
MLYCLLDLIVWKQSVFFQLLLGNRETALDSANLLYVEDSTVDDSRVL